MRMKEDGGDGEKEKMKFSRLARQSGSDHCLRLLRLLILPVCKKNSMEGIFFLHPRLLSVCPSSQSLIEEEKTLGHGDEEWNCSTWRRENESQR